MANGCSVLRDGVGLGGCGRLLRPLLRPGVGVGAQSLLAVSGDDDVRSVGVIPNPIDMRDWPLQRREERYVLWDWLDPDKGRIGDRRGTCGEVAAGVGRAGPIRPAGVL